jgi:hypothetical protein
MMRRIKIKPPTAGVVATSAWFQGSASSSRAAAVEAKEHIRKLVASSFSTHVKRLPNLLMVFLEPLLTSLEHMYPPIIL